MKIRAILVLFAICMLFAVSAFAQAPWAEVDFQRFLSNHPRLRANPALMTDPAYLNNHPNLAKFLHEHPSIYAQARAMGAYDNYNRWRDANWWFGHDPDWVYQHHSDWIGYHPEWRDDGDWDDGHHWHDRGWWNKHNHPWVEKHHPGWAVSAEHRESSEAESAEHHGHGESESAEHHGHGNAASVEQHGHGHANDHDHGHDRH